MMLKDSLILKPDNFSTLDAAISLELITESAKRINPQATNVLDTGCGAGNYTLKILSKLPDLNCYTYRFEQANVG